MAQLIKPPFNVPAKVDFGSSSPYSYYSNLSSVWNGYAFQYNATLTVFPQTHSSEDTSVQFQYDGTDFEVGMWIGLNNGTTYKIVSILSQSTNSVVCIL